MDLSEFEEFRKAISVPLLANMTEFGKSTLYTYDQLADVGFNIVIYPVTLLRLALFATEQGLSTIRQTGSQQGLLDQMQTRKALYELTDYERYSKLDQTVFNFKL